MAAGACEKVPLLAPSGSTLTITSAATAVPSNGTAQLIAQVIEPAGTPPHSGTHIIFTTTLGSVEPPEVETDVNGRAIAIFRAGNANGTATITASSGGVSVAAANVLKIAVGSAAVGGITVAASPTVLPSGGGTTTISATVVDIAGNLLPNVAVAFSSDAGSVSASPVNTDGNGVAKTSLSTTKTSKVTATAGIGATGGSGSTGGGVQTKDVTVTVNATNTISAGAVSPASPTAGQTITIALTYGTAGSPITSVRVDWGDGAAQTFTGQPASIAHQYNRAGSYLILITGVDSFGDTATTSTAITVAQPARPTVTIAASASPAVGSPVTFTITATASTGNQITGVTVDFGDGASQAFNGNVSSVQHVYASGGTYTATAIATDTSGQSGSGAVSFTVGGGPNAQFTFAQGAAGTHTVNFSGAGSTGNGTLTYVWQFGDGLPAGSGVSTSHNYLSAGTFSVSLTVTDSTGRSSTVTQNVTAP